MIDVTFKQQDGRTGTKSFQSYAQYIQWTRVFARALVSYQAFRNLRRIDSYSMPMLARVRLYFGRT